jgi:hypothetical protein
MAKALTAVGVALVLLLGGLGLAVYLSRDEDHIQVDNLLAEDLTHAIGVAEGETGGLVDLRRSAPFQWDRVVLVARGTPSAALSRHLGTPWRGRIGFQTGDLLVFVRGRTVVRFVDYRGRGRFEGFPRPFADIPRANAVLRVRGRVIRLARPDTVAP